MTDHLVILRKFWLDRVLAGRKSVEFRSSDQRRAPWGRVDAGDRLWLKYSGGLVAATALVDDVFTDQTRGFTRSAFLQEFLTGYDTTIEYELAGDTDWTARVLDDRYLTAVAMPGARALASGIDVSHLRGKSQTAWQVLTAGEAEAIASQANADALAERLGQHTHDPHEVRQVVAVAHEMRRA